MFEITEILLSLIVPFLVMYVYPRYIFSLYLKNKTILFKIIFCFALMIILITTVTVVVFYLFNENQANIIKIIFYAGLLVAVLVNSIVCLLRYKTNSINQIKRWFNTYVQKLKNTANWNWLLFAAGITFCMFPCVSFFIQYPFLTFTDMYIHCQWVYDMLEGKIFSDGIYPFGLHTCLYVFTILSDMYPTSFNLYLVVIQNLIIFICIYTFCKTLFKTSYFASIVLLLFGIFYCTKIYGPTDFELTYIAMNRFLLCLPQEFCLFALFSGMASMIMFYKLNLKKSKCDHKIQGWEYLLIYALSVATTITTHVYISFFLVVATVSIFICLFWKQKIKTIAIFACSGLIGIIAALLPYILYFTKYPKFEESIRWGLKLIFGKTKLDYVSVAASENSVSNVYNKAKGSSKNTISIQDNAPEISSSDHSANKDFFAWIGDIYNSSIVPLFGRQLTPVFVLLFFVLLGMFVFLLIYGMNKIKSKSDLNILKKVSYSSIDADSLLEEIKLATRGYIAALITLFILYILFASPVLGIPRIMESYRLVVEIYIMFTICLLIPFDLFYRLSFPSKKIVKAF